ncbi:dermonecrotic toxin domain-containing protein, partial [Pseudomonas sp. HMWF021]|uniref:dermonecrotic toxin domain-containing protein n=1 Tax=Pseudomonas sp. HMWF021 TaxID=2056857 RepID=UPI00353196C4
MPTTSLTTRPPTVNPSYDPLHAIHQNTPHWLAHASPARRQALQQTTAAILPWYANASRSQHDTLKSLIAEHWQAQNTIDEKLKALQDIQAFAEPLLKRAVKDRFGIEPDVNQTFLRLYVPQSLSWFAIKHGTRTWTVSLLAAALHNFEPSEAEDDAFDAGSTFITPPTATGQFETLPAIHAAMTPQDFIKLCRDLDIGGRYQAHLEDSLGVGNPMAVAAMQTQVNASQSSALKVALQMALMKNDIGNATHRLILGLLDGVRGVRLHGQAWHCHDLRMMSADLTGILLFAPDLEQIRETARIVVYIPDDPAHPIREYASTAAFTAHLNERLRNADYQKFFSRLVAHGQRETFFAQLSQRQSRITWHTHERGDPRPVWRETAVATPNLQLSANRITQNLQQHLFERALNKILNDAQTIAVSTASADRKARWAAWDAFSKIGMTLVGIAAMLVAPFVPLVG